MDTVQATHGCIRMLISIWQSILSTLLRTKYTDNATDMKSPDMQNRPSNFAVIVTSCAFRRLCRFSLKLQWQSHEAGKNVLHKEKKKKNTPWHNIAPFEELETFGAQYSLWGVISMGEKKGVHFGAHNYPLKGVILAGIPNADALCLPWFPYSTSLLCPQTILFLQKKMRLQEACNSLKAYPIIQCMQVWKKKAPGVELIVNCF